MTSRRTPRYLDINSVRARLSKAAGSMMAIKRMIEDGRDTEDILIQMSSARVAVEKIMEVYIKMKLLEGLDRVVDKDSAKNRAEFRAMVDRVKV
ncbi:metal-sensitive transcriptional regulator [bacterium]|nr:metal-sensitive transcriptional regulator [bacterium]